MKLSPRGVWVVLLTAVAAVWLLPLYTMLATSLKTTREIAMGQYVLPPREFAVENYRVALDALRYGLVNSTLVALPATALAVLLGSWAGFFLSRLRFRPAPAIFFLATIATFLPYQIVLIPLTQLLSVPMELQEAATLDGCGPSTFYWRILVPAARLGILSTAILIFTLVWNEFLIPTAMTQGTLNQLATPVLAGLKGNYAQLWHIQMAGATLTSLPPLVIFVVLGRYFVSGLMAGTLK